MLQSRALATHWCTPCDHNTRGYLQRTIDAHHVDRRLNGPHAEPHLHLTLRLPVAGPVISRAKSSRPVCIIPL
jgi:hypothetical protein